MINFQSLLFIFAERKNINKNNNYDKLQNLRTC